MTVFSMFSLMGVIFADLAKLANGSEELRNSTELLYESSYAIISLVSEVVVGVDVSVRRGLDVVVMNRARRVTHAHSGVGPGDLRSILQVQRPACVAIDSPPGRGTLEPGSSSRACERELRALGVNIFLTPSDPDAFAGRFYDWVRVGQLAYAAAAQVGYPLQRRAVDIRGRALEVFPHAADVFLRGCLPPLGTTALATSKRAWRLETLRSAGVSADSLCTNRAGRPTLDSIDAALAAVTALYALDGNFLAVGNPGELIVVPGRELRRFARCTGAT